MTRKTFLLIDGDMLVYTLGYASEKKGSFADGSKYHQADFTLCKKLVERAIAKYCRLFNTEEYILVMSGHGNYRTDFYPEYKLNRVTLQKPLVYEKIREWMMAHPNARVVDGEEADDFIACHITGWIKDRFIIVSADKDFFTVPCILDIEEGQQYNTRAFYHVPSRRLFIPDLGQAFCFLFFQALAGDRVDGYYGVKWMGKAKNIRILQACHDKTVRQAYLFIKKQVLKRGKTREEKRANWDQFRLCLDLAALRWCGESGERAIGIRRVFKYRREEFSYFLPYYDTRHNAKYGVLITEAVY